MRLRVVKSPRAAGSVIATSQWIAQRSLEGAERWLDALESTLELLSTQPTARGVAPESERFEETIRQMPFATRSGLKYRVLYTVRGETIFVVAVRGPSQSLLTPDDV
ncbi:type II toxin-antitoxin system RelE/ParE family toxin [Botrimarina sp.]|uniref:type II toxin-antitoxin system RelE/ParE family toxin n=1 Tax=Botrimarina sp. TaxID=2795802 RepID=UPI0032ED03A3